MPMTSQPFAVPSASFASIPACAAPARSMIEINGNRLALSAAAGYSHPTACRWRPPAGDHRGLARMLRRLPARQAAVEQLVERRMATLKLGRRAAWRCWRRQCWNPGGEPAMDRQQAVRQRQAIGWLDRAAADKGQPVAVDLDDAPAGAAQAGIDAKDADGMANRLRGHGHLYPIAESEPSAGNSCQPALRATVAPFLRHSGMRPLGAGPESITTIGSIASGLAPRKRRAPE